jgi:hypothetical protein
MDIKGFDDPVEKILQSVNKKIAQNYYNAMKDILT